VDFVTKERIVLALGSPADIRVRVIPGMAAFPLTGAGLLTKPAGVLSEVSRVYGGIATGNYL